MDLCFEVHFLYKYSRAVNVQREGVKHPIPTKDPELMRQEPLLFPWGPATVLTPTNPEGASWPSSNEIKCWVKES